MKIYWDGKSKNVIGPQVKALRKQRRMTQKALAQQLQLNGYEFSDLTILRIENGTRFVPDYEVKVLARFFQVPLECLFNSCTCCSGSRCKKKSRDTKED